MLHAPAALASQLAGGFCKLCANDRRKVLIQRHSLKVRHLRQADQLLSLVNDNPLLMSKNVYKNKPLT
jgi:hypothetical protein